MSVKKTAPRSDNFGRKLESGYGTIFQTLMLDTNLSSDARFLLAMVGTLPANWKFNVGWLRKYSGWGKEKLQKVMRELEDANRLIRVQLHNGQGYEWQYQFAVNEEWTVDDLEQEPENPAIAKQGLEKQAIGKQAIEKQEPEKQAIAKQAIYTNKNVTNQDFTNRTTTTKERVRRVVSTENGLHVEEFDLDAYLQREMEN